MYRKLKLKSFSGASTITITEADNFEKVALIFISAGYVPISLIYVTK